MVPKYTKDNLVKDYLFSDSRDKKWFLTESQANAAVREYLNKIPTAILNAFQKEGWHIIVTNENLEQRYGYNFEIYGVTDRDKKTIYIYSHQDALSYGLGHEIGHFLDEYLGFISDTEEWKGLHTGHKKLPKIPVFYFSEPEETDYEYFADCFLLYLNEPTLLYDCNKHVYEMFEKIFTNIEAIVEIVSGITIY